VVGDLVMVGAYESCAAEIYDRYASAFRGEETFAAGMDAALRAVFEELAVRPETAELLFVEVRGGDRDLLARRERWRQRFAELLAAEHARTEGSSRPPLHFELLSGGLFSAIGACVADGCAAELPGRLDEILAAAEVFEPAAA
jgi:hypothetical protein